jgi:hypothetical protein
MTDPVDAGLVKVIGEFVKLIGANKVSRQNPFVPVNLQSVSPEANNLPSAPSVKLVDIRRRQGLNNSEAVGSVEASSRAAKDTDLRCLSALASTASPSGKANSIAKSMGDGFCDSIKEEQSCFWEAEATSTGDE